MMYNLYLKGEIRISNTSNMFSQNSPSYFVFCTGIALIFTMGIALPGQEKDRKHKATQIILKINRQIALANSSS